MVFQTMHSPVLSQNSEICTFDLLLDEFSLLYLYCPSKSFSTLFEIKFLLLLFQ